MKDKNGIEIRATAACTNCAKQCDCQMLVDCESSYCSDYAGGETTYKQLFEQATARIAELEAKIKNGPADMLFKYIYGAHVAVLTEGGE